MVRAYRRAGCRDHEHALEQTTMCRPAKRTRRGGGFFSFAERNGATRVSATRSPPLLTPPSHSEVRRGNRGTQRRPEFPQLHRTIQYRFFKIKNRNRLKLKRRCGITPAPLCASVSSVDLCERTTV